MLFNASLKRGRPVRLGRAYRLGAGAQRAVYVPYYVY